MESLRAHYQSINYTKIDCLYFLFKRQEYKVQKIDLQ